MRSTAEFFVHFSQWVLTASLLSTGLMALIVLLQQILKERLIPGWSCLLWGLVLVRLLVPWSPESRFSIMPRLFPVDSAQAIWQEASSGAQGLQGAVVHASVTPDRIWTFIWLAGAAACAAHTLWSSWRFARRMDRFISPVQDPDTLALFAECRVALNVRRPVGLVTGAAGTSPALYGLLKPRVIIPAPLLTALDSEKLRHIMLHELAHAKRHDIALNWLMRLVLSIHWFNPVLWYAAGRLRQDQEMASDAMALNCLAPERRLSYGYTLIHMLEVAAQPSRHASNVYLTGSAKQLQRRIKMIKRHAIQSRYMSILAISGLLLVSGCLLTNPKSSGQSSDPARSAAPSGSPAASAPAASTAASAVAFSSPPPSVQPTGQSPADAVPAASPAASAATQSGRSLQASAPSPAAAEAAPVQLVPRAVAPSDVPSEAQTVTRPAAAADGNGNSLAPDQSSRQMRQLAPVEAQEMPAPATEPAELKPVPGQ